MSDRQRIENLDNAIKIIDTIEEDGATSQRELARRAGIAVGLANAYVKRFARKGFLKVVHAPAHRYLYYVTPKGFREKSKLVAEYLSDSFAMFRLARTQCDELISHCLQNKFKRIVLVGVSDFAEIALLSANSEDIEVVAVVDRASNRPQLFGIPIVREISDLKEFDAVIITDMETPQKTFEKLKTHLPESQILTAPMFRVNRQQLIRKTPARAK